MAQHRSVPPRLSLPPKTYRLQPAASARPYPIFTPTPRISSFSPSLTPTPSKSIRSPAGPLWLFTLLHLLSFYALNRSFSSSTSPLPLALFTFFAVLGSALFLNVIYRSWKGRPVVSSQWGFLLGSGGILAVSCLLRFEGLRSGGPLETIFSDFAGAVVAKVLLNSSTKSSATVRKARGLIALLVGIFLLSQGWARASCSPLAVDVGYRARARTVNEPRNCVKLWSTVAPSVAGFLSTFQQSMGARVPLRSLGKRRVYVLSYAAAALLLLPFAILQSTLLSGPSHWQLNRSSLPLSGIAAFGMVIAFFGDFYAEEKLLMPSHSFKAFLIVTCVVCGLELLYGLDISLAGFLFCSFVLGTGLQELALLPGQLSWEGLGDTDYSNSVYASWIKSPFQHIMSDKKSRKIAIFFLINSGFMLIEFFYGFLSNSLGLISDACHMLFDCAALGIGLYASYISRLPENSKFNYGYGRFEVVSGYANAVLLVLVASLIVLESIERILEPPEISTERLLLVSVGGLLVNLVGLVFFHEEHHHAHGSGGSCSHSHSSHEGKKLPYISSYSSTVDHDHHHTHGSSGSCSHSHSSHEGKKFPYTCSHSNGVDHDHSVVTCDATLLISQQHSDDNYGMHKVKFSIKSDGANGHKVLDEESSLPDFKSSTAQAVYGSHMDKMHCHSDALENSKADDNILPSHFTEHHGVCQEHPSHGHNANQVHHSSHVHEHVVSSAAIQEKKQGHNGNHEHSNDYQLHQDHKLCDHGHNLHHDQDHQWHQNHDRQLDMGHGQSQQQHRLTHKYKHDEHIGHFHDHDEHAHKDDHNEHLGNCHDHTHNYEHDQLGHVHGYDHDHDHHKHTHNNHDHDHNHDHGHHHRHHSHMDHNMYGIFLHVLADTLGSVGVVISTVLIKYKGWLITDPACSIFLSVLIIASVVPLLRNSAEILLQRVPRHNENDIKRALKDISMIQGIKTCQRVHSWSFTNTNIIGSLHLQISAGSDKRLIRDTVSRLLHEAGVVDLTLQVEEV